MNGPSITKSENYKSGKFDLKKVYTIPYWVMETIRQKNLSLEILNDLDEMRRHFSAFDLSFMANMGLLDQYLFSDQDFVSWNKENEFLTKIDVSWNDIDWYRLFDDQSQILRPGLSSQNLGNINEDARKYAILYGSRAEDVSFFIDQIRPALLSADSFNYKYTDPFEVIDVDRDLMVLVIYPGYFTREKKSTYQLDMIRALLKVFYVYHASHDVASHSLFKRYLELLSQK